MSKNNNSNAYYKDFWKSIGTGIVSVILSISFLGGMVTAVANSWTKFLERRGFLINDKNSSISTTEAPTPTTAIDIEKILQTTMSTLKTTGYITKTAKSTLEPTNTTESVVESTIPTANQTEPIVESTIPTIETTISTNDNFNNLDIEKYLKAIDAIEIDYKHKKYYPTKKETFKLFADATTTVIKCDYQFDGNIESIINKLIENSKKYIEENPKYVIPFKDESVQDKELMTQQIWFELTLYKILGGWENNTNNISEDFCTLENYSIVYSFDENDHENLLAYTTDDTLIIFPKRIKVHAAITGESWEDVLHDVMNRQLNTIRQKACKCKIYKGQSYNQIPTTTLTDAATESETKFYDKASSYNRYYQDEKESEELLLTLGLFRDGITYDDYYNAIYNSDLESLHTFFNAHTEEEINKLYTILYAIDAVNLKNDLLLTYYDKDDLVSFNDITTFVGHSYKIDIFKTVLKNMIQYTNTHDDFTLLDNLIMYKYIEGLIVQDSYEMLDIEQESDTIAINFESDFTKNIYTLRKIYYEFLCNKYNISILELKEIEANDINNIIFYINYYCQEKYHIIPERYYYSIEKIVERFPLLKKICNATYYSSYGIELFENSTRTK